MIVLETIAVAFAMFSAVPVPQPTWNQWNMRYALCAFPLVGVVIGLAWWAWAAVCGVLEFPALLRAAGFCLLPPIITGGIHLDGYADTSDALASHADPARKQEILKDSHCGAFAIIRLCAYFVGYFALCGALEADRRGLVCCALGFVLSRTLSGFAVAAFPLARNTGLAHTFATAAVKSRVRLVLALWAAAMAGAMCLIGGLCGGAMVLAALVTFWWYHHVAVIQFHGLSGDLAGWFLQKAEFWMLAALVLCRRLEACV